VERVNEKVMQGMSFREAYHAVSTEIKQGKSSRPKGITYTHEGSIGNLCNEKIKEIMQMVLEQFPFERIEKACKKLLS
jgi:argininosuccinate lyase